MYLMKTSDKTTENTNPSDKRGSIMKVKYYTETEVRKIKKDSERQGREDGISGMMLLGIWAIHDVLSPKPEKMQECLDFMEGKGAFLSNGEISFSDIQKMLFEETGITVLFNKERFR